MCVEDAQEIVRKAQCRVDTILGAGVSRIAAGTEEWPDDLSKLWFALGEDIIPPSWVYIELNDRQTNTKYKSNLADTTL